MNYKQIVAQCINNALDHLSAGQPEDEIFSAIEIPPNPGMGDFAYPCYKLSKALRKAPQQIAVELADAIKKQPGYFRDIQTAGPYINFYVNMELLAETVINEILGKSEQYGSSNEGAGKTIVIDYSSPNVAKHFHVGHLRSTVIGAAIYNLYAYLGYTAVGINHLGDWGTQFGKLIVAYLRYGSKEAVEQDGLNELLRIYVKFHDEADKDPALEDEARAWFLKMQEGDSEALSYWKWFNDISKKEFNRIYDLLKIEFDYTTGESFYSGDPVAAELKEKGLLKESNGAMIVDLEPFDMPPCLILRSDGGTLYSTRDIAAAKYRKETFNFDKCLYITAFDQNLHFAQWFKVLELMDYAWAKDLVHIPFGLINFEAGKLSTRKGNIVLMEPLLRDAINKTLGIIEQKNPALKDKERVAEAVGIGAVKFNDLYNSRIKDVAFSWERMLNFEGETGPYVQYTHARACSIIKKGGRPQASIDFSCLTDEYSIGVIKLLMDFGGKIQDAARKYEPYILTRHLVDISQAFNKFYAENTVLAEDAQVKNARLALVLCVSTVLKTGLSLLGIESPDEM